MLDENRFLAMKKLARDIREENEEKFKSFEQETVEKAIMDKEEFISSLIADMPVAFSEGEKGKEEKQIFRANLLIPDDEEFFQEYSKDKNIRNLMNKYAVGIEDIMSKITELNVYNKYIDTFNRKDNIEEGFVDDMINLSSKEAENLLDEIEDLSNAMEDLGISSNEENNISLESEEKEISLEPNKNDISLEPEVVSEKEDNTSFDFEIPEETIDFDIISKYQKNAEINEEIEDISTAVSDIIDEYTKVKKELEFTQAKIDKFSIEKEKLKQQLSSVKAENESLEKQNKQIKSELDTLIRRLKNHLVKLKH